MEESKSASKGEEDLVTQFKLTPCLVRLQKLKFSYSKISTTRSSEGTPSIEAGSSEHAERDRVPASSIDRGHASQVAEYKREINDLKLYNSELGKLLNEKNLRISSLELDLVRSTVKSAVAANDDVSEGLLQAANSKRCQCGNGGNFQTKKSVSPNIKGGPKAPQQQQLGPPGGKQQFGNTSREKKPERNLDNQKTPNRPQNQNQQKSPDKPQNRNQQRQNKRSSTLLNAQQNGREKKGDSLRQLNDKSKPNFKTSKEKQNCNEGQKARNRNKPANRYHRFQERISKKVRTPQSCARALKVEQELTASNNRILKITLPDPVISPQAVQGWTDGIESVLFTKSLEPRHFTIVLRASANPKKEMNKLSKITVGNGKLTVKENEPKDLGHTKGTRKDPADLIDPYTLYVTNLPEGMSRMDLEKLFPGALVSSPKKHSPKMGTPSKFAFVSFDTPEAALAALKENLYKEIQGRSLVMRFRRLKMCDLQKEEKERRKKGKGDKQTPKNKYLETLKGSKAVKQEPVDEDDDDDDE